MKELMSLPDNDIQAMVCFFETNGSFFKVGDANFESLYFEDVIEIINRLKATVAFMNKIESPEIDYERMISLTLYLHLSQKISIELSTLPRLYVSYKHFLSNEIDKASQLTEIDGQQEAFQKDTYTIRDSIYGSYELDIEEYNDVVSENIYANRYPGYLDMRYKAIVTLFTALSMLDIDGLIIRKDSLLFWLRKSSMNTNYGRCFIDERHQIPHVFWQHLPRESRMLHFVAHDVNTVVAIFVSG